MRLPLLVLIALASGIVSAVEAASAAGTIGRKGKVLKVVDAFAYEAKGAMSDEPSIRLRLSGKPLDQVALAGALDFERELDAQQDGSEYAELEFSPQGQWSGGGSFTLRGASCGWCQHSAQADKAKVTVAGGILKGTLTAKATDVSDGDGLDADLILDLPVARQEGVTPLPATGGDPGKAFLACVAAMKTKDEASVVASCLAPDDPFLKDRSLDPYTGDEFAVHVGQWYQGLTLQDVTVAGGRVKGDQAEILVKGRIVRSMGQGEPDDVTPYKGKVFLRRAATGWRFTGQQLDSNFE